MGLPILASVLRDDRDDIEMVRGALEALVLAVGQPAASASETGLGAASAAEVRVRAGAGRTRRGHGGTG
jgi:hypothetical protein